MLIENQRYEFVPPDGDPAQPIIISGRQPYSPGQDRKSTVWLLTVPQAYQELIPDQTELTSFGETKSTLARVFFDGDESRVTTTTKRPA